MVILNYINYSEIRKGHGVPTAITAVAIWATRV